VSINSISANSISTGVAERAVPIASVPSNKQSSIATEQEASSKSEPSAIVAIAQQSVQAKEQSSPDSSGTQQQNGQISAQVLRFDADKLKDGEVDSAQKAAKGDADKENLKVALDRTNKLSNMQSRKLEFTSGEDKGGQVVVKVLDKESNEVIRQIPSEDFIKVAQKLQNASEALDKPQGMLFESQV
jgi:flagellar protein FlaG